MAAALSRHVTVRPDFERVISPASVSTSMCFITAGSDILNGFASSLTDKPSDASSRASNARLVGSARAANVRSSGSAE
jgi:hypothetical protein